VATSLRYQARMVSGLATQAISRSALRPRRLPISARVVRSGLLNRNLDGSFALRIRFSAARYSFCSRSCWFTEPVTYASSRTHFLFLMLIVYLTLVTASFVFLTMRHTSSMLTNSVAIVFRLRVARNGDGGRSLVG
jgi:hypothetical protein